MNPKICVIIPARGGSKENPRKNLVPIGGIALIARTVSTALRAASVGSVVVSTDDDEIAAVASRHGAQIVRRPHELSGDLASSESALLHALDRLAEAEAFRNHRFSPVHVSLYDRCRYRPDHCRSHKRACGLRLHGRAVRTLHLEEDGARLDRR